MRSLVLLLALAACAEPERGPSYADQLDARPMPVTDDQRQRECAYIRSEIARQQGLAGAGGAIATNAMQAALYNALAQQNIAALESRAANVNCRAAFSPAPLEPREAQATPKIRECILACKENTSRTSTECFDACNK